MYGEPISRVCFPCVVPCVECYLQGLDVIVSQKTSNMDIICLSCAFGYYLLNGRCVVKCPDTMSIHTIIRNNVRRSVCSILCPNGYVSVQELTNDMFINICKICISVCLTCAGDPDNCTQCSDGRVLQQFEPSSKTLTVTRCQQKCSDGYYVTSTRMCELCDDQACVKCYAGGGFYCALCKTGYYLQLGRCVLICNFGLYGVGSKCVTDCPDGYRSQQATGECIACGATCRACTTSNTFPSETVCTGCFHNYYLLDGACVRTCPITHIALLRQSPSDIRLLNGNNNLDGQLVLHYQGTI